MAFMGMFLGAAAIIILLCLTGLALLFFVLAIIFKIIGKAKDKRGLKIAGWVFTVLCVIFVLPDLLVAGFMIFNANYAEVALPNGKSTYVKQDYYAEMFDLAKCRDDESMGKLKALIEKNPNLIYARDSNFYSILEIGLNEGNSDVVKIAIDNGSRFDDPAMYDMQAYVKTSMEDFIGTLYSREIREEDIEIIKMMFEEGASTDLYKPGVAYSNIFGYAVWAVLYNDGDKGLKITDMELVFIQTFIDKGEDSDSSLIFVEDVPANYSFPENYYGPITKDDNYDRLIELTGMEK